MPEDVEINRLYIQDNSTDQRFLVDTGADVSVLPYHQQNQQAAKQQSQQAKYKNQQQTQSLYAANGSTINTYGVQRLSLNLGLRRDFEWIFILADVRTPILGADFLNHFDLLVDVRGAKLIDKKTFLSVNGVSFSSNEPQGIKSFSFPQPFGEMVNKHKALTNNNTTQAIKVDTLHYIETTGPPCFAKARRLPPDKLLAAKQEFALLQIELV